MKQTFNIPEGCKTVTVEQIGNYLITSFEPERVEQIGNYLITSFEPERYVPKAGDLVKVVSPVFKSNFIFECAGINKDGEPLEAGDTIFNGAIEEKNDVGHCIKSTFTKLTPEEFQAEFEKLGYVYDFETHTAKKKRWRAKLKRDYYFVSASFDVEKGREDAHSIDNKRYKNGNYFKNRENAEVYRDYMLQHSLKFHKNNNNHVRNFKT